MLWYQKLRWKLFISHLLIIVVAMVVLLGVAHFLARTGLGQDSTSTLEPVAAEAESIIPNLPNPVPDQSLQRRFQLVVDQALLIAAFAALATAVVVSLFVSRRIVEPIMAIATVSRRLAQGFYRERTVIASDDELADLSHSVNQLAATLEQTEQRRLNLLADVAHELRTPLATIEGYMEGLIDGVVKPNTQTFSLVLRESIRLQRLIEDLTLLSQVESGQIVITPRQVDLHIELINITNQFEPQAAAKAITLHLDLPPTLPPIWADPDRVEQMMINLLANALHYTPNGGIVTIHAHLEGADGIAPSNETKHHDQETTYLSPEQWVRIEVLDTGIGIAPEYLPHVFDRFYRVDKSRARTSGGSGIGLTITRYLVYAHGGEVWLESDGPGQGTTAVLLMPATTLAMHELVPEENTP